jgi:CRISPR-associated protein Cst1
MEESTKPLEFTGNWFIDAGILGFVNLMEEVYGWDLGKLNKELDLNREKVVYIYFPMGYLFRNSVISGFIKQRNALVGELGKLPKKRRVLRDNLNLLNAEKKALSSEDKGYAKKGEALAGKIAKTEASLVEEMESLQKKKLELDKILKDQKKEGEEFCNRLNNIFCEIIEDSSYGFKNVGPKITDLVSDFDLNPTASHRNFFIYNPKKSLFDSFRYIYFLLKGDNRQLNGILKELVKSRNSVAYEEYLDSTSTPFLYSEKDGSNLGYTQPMAIQDLEHTLDPPIPVYAATLAFAYAFSYVGGRQVYFYTNNLEICYNLNKRLSVKKELSRNPNLFRVAWSSVMDELIEQKARFSLENLYLVEFDKIKNQKVVGVDYLGISQSQATLLLDETVRSALSTRLSYGLGREKSNLWLLEGFLKRMPIYPSALRLFWEAIGKGRPLDTRLFYALAIDAHMRGDDDSQNIFSMNFFDNPRGIVSKIKRDVNWMYVIQNAVHDIYLNEAGKKPLLYEIFSALKSSDRSMFMNIILRTLNQISADKKKRALVDTYISSRVLKNRCWEIYALPILNGLLK